MWQCHRRHDHNRVLYLQAKVRRLYDIANVLTSLALIEKVHVTEERGRKPAFKWIGPVDFSSSGKAWTCEGPISFIIPQFLFQIIRLLQSETDLHFSLPKSHSKIRPVMTLLEQWALFYKWYMLGGSHTVGREIPRAYNVGVSVTIKWQLCSIV